MPVLLMTALAPPCTIRPLPLRVSTKPQFEVIAFLSAYTSIVVVMSSATLSVNVLLLQHAAPSNSLIKPYTVPAFLIAIRFFLA